MHRRRCNADLNSWVEVSPFHDGRLRNRLDVSPKRPPATEGQYHSPNDAPEHIRHQLAAAAFAKQKIQELISSGDDNNDNDNTKHTGSGLGRIEAVHDQLRLRALHAFLLCPDAEDVPVFFFDDRYAPCHTDGVDEFLDHNERLCTSGAKALGLWKNNTYRLLDEIEYGKKKKEEDEKAALRRVQSFQIVLRWFFRDRFLKLVPELLSGKGISDLLSCLDDESLPSLWRRCSINIRPLPCINAEDAGKKLEVQFLRFNDEDPLFGDSIYEVGGRLDDDDDDEKGSKSERGDDPGTAAAAAGSPSPPRIRSGDVYVLETSDPETNPLPSRDLLLLQYHLHTVRHRLEARGTLQSLFGGPPLLPETIAGAGAADPVSGSREEVDFDETIVAEAVGRGIVSEEDGGRWIAALGHLNRAREEEREA
ncbi:hypothetical protein PG997_009116 [Apiospora hydei]|uniref:HNH nuclease domain-containing protein n=1 Tax=Apiospora hydei TaxID=1337664 RepID=A0ABR1VT98_9PEZI